MKNNGKLVTENNGFERLPRFSNGSRPVYRNSWPNAVASTVLDESFGMAAITGQTHTVMSPNAGTLQFLLHRRANIKGLSGAVVLDDASTHRETIQVSSSYMEVGGQGVGRAQGKRQKRHEG